MFYIWGSREEVACQYQRRREAGKGEPLAGTARHGPLWITSNAAKQKDKEVGKPDLKVKTKSTYNCISFSTHFSIHAFESPRDLVRTADGVMPWSGILDFFFSIFLHVF